MRAILLAFCLLGALFATPSITAGSVDNPEVIDPAADTNLTIDGDPGAAGTLGSSGIDVVQAWIGFENETSFNFTLQMDGDIGGFVFPDAGLLQRYKVGHVVNGEDMMTIVDVEGLIATEGFAVTVRQNATSAAVNGNILNITVDKNLYAQPPVIKDRLSGLYVATQLISIQDLVILDEDRAPDFGVSLKEYAFGDNWQRPDMDNDGMDDAWEEFHFGNTGQPGAGDADQDGVNNRDEFRNGGNPNEPDSDSDGLTDGQEYYEYNTRMDDPDSDNDGLTDKEEVDLGTDPNNPDSDGDGVTDGAEVEAGTDPMFNPDSVPEQGNETPTPDVNETPEEENPVENPTGGETGNNNAPGGSQNVTESDSFFEPFEENLSYIGISAGLLVVVLILVIIALVARWKP